MSTQLDPAWYKAWHTWALANFKVVNHLETGTRTEDILPETLVTHIIAAIKGFHPSLYLTSAVKLTNYL